MLVYMPLKYDKIFSCIHCLLCLWQLLRLDVFYEVGEYRYSVSPSAVEREGYVLRF